MAEICVIYLSEDKAVVRKLVTLLQKHWDVSWAEDQAHGDWELRVREEIRNSKAVVAVLSQHANEKRIKILKDEMRYADKNDKAIFPFLIGPAEIPFGFGDLSYTEAHGWRGTESHEGYLSLKKKLTTVIGEGRRNNGVTRLEELNIRGKTLRLPAFVFSLSSHETQLNPKDGVELLKTLGPSTSLISAYDVWKYYSSSRDFHANIKYIRQSQNILFMDSGNYEAYRKNDRHSPKKNPSGWHNRDFIKVSTKISPDIAFAYDSIPKKGTPESIVKKVVADFAKDDRVLQQRDFFLCPIVHLPIEVKGIIADYASKIVSGVAAELDPPMIAIPERELGSGLLERIRTVRGIRHSLNALGKYYPLHLLGTGNPLSMISLAAAGADSFDGLEWCRTVVDYPTGYLFHFQQFDFFSKLYLNRIQDHTIRFLIENPHTPYNVRWLSYNVDFFRDWTRTMQNMIHSGQTETLLKMVPNIGPEIFKELSK